MKQNYIVKYPATYDIIFQNAFSDKETLAELTSCLLNVKVEAKEIQIKSNLLSQGINFKTSNMDIRYSILDKMNIDMEMQQQNPPYSLEDRLNYYLGQLVASSLEKGKEYGYKRNCVICFTNFELFKSKECIKHFQMRDGTEGEEIRGMEIITIDLTKKEKCDNIELKKWLGIMTSTNLEEYKGGNQTMNKAIDKILESNQDKDIQEMIFLQQREMLEEALRLSAESKIKRETEEIRKETEEMKRETAMIRQETEVLKKENEELEKRIARGKLDIERGKLDIERGQKEIAEGKKELEEGQNRLEEEQTKLKQGKSRLEEEQAKLGERQIKLARNLLRINMSIEEISEITGLDIKKIEELK